jgi:oligosaccharide repeat unit polymerase
LNLYLLHVGGIPLLDPSLHSRHLTAYLLLGFPIVPISALLLAEYIEKKKGLLAEAAVILPTLLLTLLLGYRTDIIAGILSFTLVYYFFGRISGKKLAALAASAVFAIVILGFIKASASGSVAGPIDVFAGRIEGTASLYDYIVLHSSPFGSMKGELHNAALSTLTYHLIPGPSLGPRALIAEFFGARADVTFTATILGPLYLDFGVFGVLLGLGLLGFALSLAFKGIDADKRNASVYAVLLAFSFIAIETGILDIVLFYFFSALFYLLVCLRAR